MLVQLFQTYFLSELPVNLLESFWNFLTNNLLIRSLDACSLNPFPTTSSQYFKQRKGHQKYLLLQLKYKMSPIRLLETACIFLTFLISTVQISMECETQESQEEYTRHIQAQGESTINAVINLYNVSINKILVTEFNTTKVSQNLNLM